MDFVSRGDVLLLNICMCSNNNAITDLVFLKLTNSKLPPYSSTWLLMELLVLTPTYSMSGFSFCFMTMEPLHMLQVSPE